MLMKTILRLILGCCCGWCLQVVAQTNPEQHFLQQYIATDTSGGSAWLVKVKDDSMASFLTNTGTGGVLRRLSKTGFIIVNKEHVFSNPAFATIYPANNNWKLSARLLINGVQPLLTENGIHDFYIQCHDIERLKKKWALPAYKNATIVYEYENTLQIRTGYQFIQKNILTDKNVNFIDLADRLPREEVSIAGFDNSLNKINKLQSQYPEIDGRNILVSVKENRPDTADIDFKGRFISTTGVSTSLSSHATIMSTMIAGAGNSFYTSRGVAPAGHISSTSFAVLLPENDAWYRQYGISVQNHSYGTGIENFYGADAAAYDESVNNNPALLHVFSSGNSGTGTATDGQYTGLNGFANLTGSFKMAKNIITVGSADSLGVIPALSSKGPAYDGRVKPDMVAFGEDGSSGAAALVSGTAMILQQVYKEQNTGILPDAALVKAILLNSASKPGNKGIDFSSGYGNLDAYRAAAVMKAARFFTAELGQGQSQSFTISVPANAKNLKILLAWTDKPAAANAYTAIVNDLDLTVMHTSSAQQWQPWVLNASPNKDSLQLMPTRKRDSLNTVEQVSVEDPPTGDYTIRVDAHAIPAGTQKFFVAYQWDTANSFQWVYPSGNDNLLPKKTQLLRWQTNTSSSGQLAFKYAGTETWQTIDAAVIPYANYFTWALPDTNAVAILRMTINGQQYLSDSFTISAPLQTSVGFNCDTQALIYWTPASTSINYIAYKLGNQYMEPFLQTADTAFIINKTNEQAEWYSVAPLLSFNKRGINSLAFNYTTQGVACYIKSFTADLFGNTARLNLSLGTTFRILRIVIEKKDRQGIYQPLQVYTTPLQLQYAFTDNSITQGLNIYRVRVETSPGSIVYSDNESVYFLAGSSYLIYPNPVSRPQPLNILTAEPANQLIQLFDAYGRKIKEEKIIDISEQIETAGLAKGIYLFIIWKEGHKDASGKIIVQ